MDLRKLKTLIDLVSDSNISELEITDGEGKVKIVKADPRLQMVPIAYAPAPAMAAVGGSASAGVPLADVAPGKSAGQLEAEDIAAHAVKSPMVGTFYRASSPGGKPLVDVGSQVQIGEPLCIIEAMKIMNEIEADRSGTVRRVMCENGQAVEFGQPLLLID